MFRISTRPAVAVRAVRRGRPARPRRASGALALLALAAIGAAFLLPGCKTAGSDVRPAVASTVPDWADLQVESLAFLGVGSGVGDETSRRAAQDLVQQHLLGAQDRFIILGFEASQERAAAAKAATLFDKVVGEWQNHRTIDQFEVQELCEKLGVNGLIVANVSDWKRERVDFTSEGSSYTQIALEMAIYAAQTGRPAWTAEKMIRRESLTYAPASGGSGVYTDPSGVSRAQRSGSMTPDPPRAEEVVADIMASIIAAFPPRPAS